MLYYKIPNIYIMLLTNVTQINLIKTHTHTNPHYLSHMKVPEIMTA